MFSVRLISTDSYQAQPVPQLDPTFSAFRGSEIKHVPVIRIFGTTANGEKTCLHVHGVFPYLFVPYTGEEGPEILAYRLAAALDAAINVSLGSATSNTQHVYSVQRVSGIPFYGYHMKEHQFLKIYFYNPAMIKRAAELLQNGSVLNQSLQPHEAHINYILQFMMDYNIYGMSLVNLRSCKHRRVAQSLAQLSSSGQSINSESSDIVYLPNEIERQSTCELEVDALASDILNRLDIENDLELNPGLAAIWEEERARRAQAGFSGGDSQLVNPKSPTRPPFEPTDHDVYQEQRLARRLLMISQCDESTLSSASHRSMAYAAETRDNENLMNASHLPNVSVQRTERPHQGGQDESLENMSFIDSPMNPASQNFTPDSSILGSEDMPLVDLLAQLARETEINPETVDADSLLGSQMSSVLNENKSDNEEEEEEDAADLNLTCLELDSLGSIEAAVNRVGKSSQTESPIIERKNKSSSVPEASPFSSPCEISSSSTKSTKDEKEAGERAYSRTSRVPQYDGAGDVSPTLLNSDHEDSRDIPNTVKDYERLPEYNDFADMRSSMEIGILLSSGDDNEKAESLGESNQDEDDENDDDDANDDDDVDEEDDSRDVLPLESVLNGDPCFTESAELDKSDLAELRDQYVSLLDNALLPEVRDSSRIDSDDLEDTSSNFAVAHFETIEKSCPVSPDITTSRGALVTSRGSTSSLENVAPNVPRPSSIVGDHDDPRNRKDAHVATSNDTADYNCNVVATWEELQNLRIIDKSENERATNPSRRRPRSGKYVPGPRSKRRERRSSSLDRAAAGQLVSESAEKDAKGTSEAFHESDETLSRVFDVTRLSQSSNENTSLEDYPRVQRRDSLEAFRRSIIGTDNPLADIRSTLPGARYSTYPSLRPNDSLVEPILADFEETSDELRDDQTETLSDAGAQSLYLTSYYAPRRSLSHSEVEDRQHRHCFVSKHNKIVQDHVFASDQLWIIQRRKRGSINSSLRNVCNNEDCKLPVVFVQKLEKTRREERIFEENAIASIDESFSPQVECTVSATERPAPRIIPTSERSVESAQSARLIRTRSKRETAATEATIGSIEKMDSNDDTARRPVEPLSRETSVARCVRRHRDAVRTKRDHCDTRRRLRGSQFAKKRRRNARTDAESGEKSRSGRKKARARTKYKEGTLPGIPGIVNHETPVKRRRSRKIVLSSNDSENVDSSKTRKASPSSSARRNETGYAPNVAKKSPANGLVAAPLYIDVPPEKLRGQRINAAPPINPATKRRASSRDDAKDSSRLEDLSGSPEKFADTRQSRSANIRSKCALASKTKLPETVTLGLMLQEARSPGTRKALQLLLQKRLNERLEREETKNERAVRKSESSEVKTTETKVAADRVVAKKEAIVQHAYEVTNDRTEVAESPKILDDGLENSTISEAPSFETVNDSDANSQNLGDTISIASIDSEICHPVEFDAGTTTLGAEFSVDDAAIVIFDGNTDAESVIVETTGSEEFTNVVRITYDTDRYENAIKEANFFAGINYSIDAVSNEIPTCLFEEDSNSVDKRLPKRTSEISAESADDPDALSELSADLRDLDVYDVESLTSTCSVSAHDETTDATETSPEMSDENSNVIEDARIAGSNENFQGQQTSIKVDHFEDAIPEQESNFEDAIPEPESNFEDAIPEQESNFEDAIPEQESNFEDAILDQESSIKNTIPELESSFEEDSPSFEALSPEPRVILTLVPALEEEFAVDCPLESTEIGGDQTALAEVHDEILGASEHFSVPIDEEKLSLEIDISEDNATSEHRPDTPNVEFSTTNESSEIASFPNSSIEADKSGGRVEPDQINDDPKAGSEIDPLISAIDAEHENELEVPKVLETGGKTDSPVDTEIQKDSKVQMDDAVNEEASSSTEKENPVLTISPKEIDVSESVEENSKASSDETYEENDYPPIAEEDDKLSTTCEEARNRTFVEIEEHPDSICRDLPEALPEEENEFSASTEKQSDEATPVEQKKQLPEIAEEGTEVPAVVEEDGILTGAQFPITAHEDAELPEPSAGELELSASREVDEQSSSGMEEESASRITVYEQRDGSAQSLMDVEFPTILQKDEELPESNKSHLAGNASVEKDLCSSTLGQSCLPVPTETDEQLLESTQIQGSQPENDLSSNDSAQTGTRIETDDELPKGVECGETCEEPTDLSLSLEGQPNTRAFVVEDEFSLRERMKVEGATVVQSHEAKSDSDEKSGGPRPAPEDEPSSVTSIAKTAEEKIASPISNENDHKLRATVKSATALSSADNDDADSQVAANRVAEEEETEKVPRQFVDEEETIAADAEKVPQQIVDEGETIAENAEKVPQQIVDEEETIAEDAEKVPQQIVDEKETIAAEVEKVPEKIVNEEKTIAEEAEKVAQRFMAEEETMEEAQKLEIEEPSLSQRLETEETQSQVENDETCEKYPTSETEVPSGEEEMLENRKNEAQSTNASPETRSRGDKDRACEDEPKALLECRPVSIKLVNIDLSKIRSFAPKTCHKPTSPDRESSQALPQDANQESDETMTTEASKTTPKNCNDGTSVLQTIGPIVKNLEKSITTEAQVHQCSDKVRRRRGRIPKDTRMPERRSVRICAEMTLKLSLKHSPKKSTESTMECLTRESGSGVPMPDSLVSESRILQKDGSLSEEIRKISGHSEVARSSSTVRASMDDDSPRKNDDSTRAEVGASPGQEFTLCQSKPNVSQELVLSEQTMANGNAAPSSMKAPNRGRLRKRAQSQEAPSSPRIIDENTAPTSDNPKRKKSQVNLQEALVDFESSKSLISEEAVRRNVDKTSTTGVDAHPAEFDLKIAKSRNADLQSLSIKRRRGRPFGCRKIRRRTQDRLSSVSAKSNRDELKNSRESEESTRTGHRDLTPCVILALPTLDTLKNVPDVGRDDEPSLPEESAREVTSEPRVSARRGRSEKKSDADKAASERDSSPGKNYHSDAEAHRQPELTLEKNPEEYVGPVANRRRGRSGKISEIFTSPLATRRSVEIPLRRSEALSGRSEESNEPKTPVVLERSARRGASPETRLASRLQRSTNTEPGTSVHRRKRGRPPKYSVKRIGAFENIERVPTEKSSQEPDKLLEKIISRDVETSPLVADTLDDSHPLSPRPSLGESQESTLERRIVVEENDVPDRENSSGDSSSMRKIADNYREGTGKNVLPGKCRPFYRWRRIRRWSRKPRPLPKQLPQSGSSSDEATSKTAKEYSEGSDPLTQRILEEKVDSNTVCVSVRRRRRGQARCRRVTTVAKPTANEKAGRPTGPTTQPDGAETARKTLEERPASLTNSPPTDVPMTNPRPETSTTPKKRVRFDEQSIARSAKDRQDSSETSEPCLKKLHKQTEIDSSGPARDIVQEAREKGSDDSSGSEDIGRASLDSVSLFARLKALGNDRRENDVNDANPTDAEEREGSTFSRRSDLSVVLSSCGTGARARFQRKRKRGISRQHVPPGSKEYAVHGDDKLSFSRTKFTKFPEASIQLRNLRGDYSSRCSSGDTIAYAQLKRPIILLKRLSRKSLKRYGIAYRPRDRTFVKLSRKFTRRCSTEDEEDDEEFKLPACDGAADLSSSDEEDPDVTIAREEKRICSYGSSAKKVALAKRDESSVTPKKRKPEVAEEASSPAKKRQVDATQSRNNVTPVKKSYRSSPGGTSTLKTPGGGSARIYSPLKIIVTSPKVRKETLETKSSRWRMEQPEGNANNPSTSSFTDSLATTTARKNSRLHDTVLRGRLLNTAKSSLRELGDKHVTVDKTGSNAVGELDEIRSIVQTEKRIVNKLHTSIAAECHEASRPRDSASSTTLPDGKDVRKRLLFSDNDANRDNEKVTDSPITEVHEAPEIRTSRKDIERLGGIDDDEGSIEVATSPKNRGVMMFEAVPGPSRCYDSRIFDDGTNVNTDYEEDDDDVCNVTFTQYIESQKSKNESSFSANHETSVTKERITIMPKFKPPNRQRIVDTMEKYGIAKCRNEAPFFSVAADVPRQKELAHRMLGVPGKSIDFLPAFVPSLEGVTGLARWRKMWLNEFHPSLARSKEHAIRLALASSSERIILTPLARPPTRKQVKDWLRAREYLARKRNADEEAKKELKQPDVEETKRTSKQSDVEEPTIKLKESERLEARADEDGDNDESDSSDVSVVEPSPERTLVSKDLEKMARSATSVKLAKRTLFEVNPAKSSEKNDSSSRGTGNPREKITSGSNELADPSLLDILEKSGLFRDQEGSRHLGLSRGQIEFLSDSTRGNVTAENLRNVKALTRYQYLTIMCLEVHVATRGDFLPDAQHDSIAAIFYSIQSDVPPESSIKPLEHGVIVVAEDERSRNKIYYAYASKIPWTVNFASNEEALLNSLVTLITRTDPEILIGWELETLSWGYVFMRASRLGMNLFKRVSRIPATQYKWEFQAPDIETLAEVKLPGRIVLDIWRIMRHEAALLSYTFESVMHHVLNERIPCPSYCTLTNWWNLARARPCRWRVVEHYSTRVLGVFRILDQLDIIGRTSELARLFGIQFYEVFSRGSQFRVESVMLRLAKPLNYIAVSPSSQQRASMRAMEALPLIMEPESMLYSDPLIVLDFQSLYPSIIIAHNYCFSTCLGRIEHIGQPEPFEFGAYTLRVPKRTALKLQGKVNYAPCGVAYVKPEVRLGILPRMLTEILETRFMVKKAMKDHNKEDKTLQRALHSRQMGLKFLANVTYGYTAANFSGRMPCIEVGDSVISKSKETLERAIKLVESTPKWGARVVYGDTDSLFILVPGKSKDEAFVIGNEIADAVTASNPPPIKLKFEKILYPAILQTKKRYCGYMYETQDQANPTYLAKGIETVRRDGCPAVSKILEKTLKILFETKDVSLVKKYVTRQLDKVLRGKVSIQDLTFAKEFRGLKGYKAKACVPALELTRRLAKKDPRAVPRTSERVRYVIIAGAPNQALIHCVRTPWELINDPGLRPNAIYYVTRVIIPPLNRCLNLMGVDVNEWYREMPHRQVLDNPVGQPCDKQKLTIFQYFGTIVCVACGQPSNKGICVKCLGRPADTLVAINEKLRWLDRTNNHVTAICQSCVGQADAADCASLDCPVLYRRAQARRELTQAIHLREIIECGNNLEF